MEVANSIPELLNIEPSELSVRHGESVAFDSVMKMLYVALTRALHKLDIIYIGEITQPLKKFVEEKTYTKKI